VDKHGQKKEQLGTYPLSGKFFQLVPNRVTAAARCQPHALNNLQTIEIQRKKKTCPQNLAVLTMTTNLKKLNIRTTSARKVCAVFHAFHSGCVFFNPLFRRLEPSRLPTPRWQIVGKPRLFSYSHQN
jgi:hypothetical protein